MWEKNTIDKHSEHCGWDACQISKQYNYSNYLSLDFEPSWNLSTVECLYNAVQYDKRFHTALRGLMHSITHTIKSQITPPYLTLTGELWHENWPLYNGTPLYKTSDWMLKLAFISIPQTQHNGHMCQNKLCGNQGFVAGNCSENISLALYWCCMSTMDLKSLATPLLFQQFVQVNNK